MLNDLEYSWINGENASIRIRMFLFQIDDDIIPPLSERVNIEEYALKLAVNAMNIFITKNGIDVASSSVYCNKEEAYISSIAVKKEYQHMGIGTYMMELIKEYVKKQGNALIALKVARNNERAYLYYLQNGFEVIYNEEDWITMRCVLL